MGIKRKLDCENDYGDGVGWIRGRVLGKGSFGSVYKATAKGQSSCFPAELAVKSSESSVSDTLRHEMEVMGQLKGCSSVIQCYGQQETVGDKGGVRAFNLLLEFCSGGSLAERIGELWRLPEAEVREHTESLLMGLSHIHGLGYVHCDLKPENILLVPKCGGCGFTAKIGDFGLSKKRNTKLGGRGWAGTPMYLSPESAAGYEQEAAADVWALGCVVFQMLTGWEPWEGRESEILECIVSENGFPKIPDFLSSISTAARDFLACCFERHTGWRWTAKSLLGHPFVKGSCKKARTEDRGIVGSITARPCPVAFTIAAGA